ncbi:MAG TPA: carboxypeptidase-like regulatory domain-containing protein [Urbifossiella sp.]|nr:carboxypeptidase-like regulatory domain-containing protein [Urbifossiella sp.]
MTCRVSCWIAVVFAAGCGSEPTLFLPEPPVAACVPTASSFDAARSGTITGRVTWAGELPAAPTFLYGVPSGDGNFVTKTVTGPNQPRIDTATRTLAGAVVTLRGIDPAAARPWDHAPVRVEVGDGAIRVRQGVSERVGFVRRGTGVELVSREPAYHVLRGRGDDFFSLSLPIAEQPRTRSFARPGRVELSSGTGLYWAQADLFVSDHPYWAVTDAEGRFTLSLVPAGRVEVVVWHPNWRPARQDRDPETGLISRMTYGSPLERTVTAEVAAGGVANVAVTLSD